MTSYDRPVGGSDPSADEIRFAKLTSFGNSFIVVDESATPLRDDQERGDFARWALDAAFGIGGADNVLYLQQCRERPAADGDSLPAGSVRLEDVAAFTFRIFEHDGSETLSCGNGLLSTVVLLRRAYPGCEWHIVTELPSGAPRVVVVGIGSGTDTWVNLGWPRGMPAALYRNERAGDSLEIQRVDSLIVEFPAASAWARHLPRAMAISGRVVFTGEPHLVLLSGDGLPALLEERLFASSEAGHAEATQEESSALLDHIGRWLNSKYRDLFPQGIHVNVARRVATPNALEYRTYERAIDRETLACGTGAVAVASVARHLHMVTDGTPTILWPHRCRWHAPAAVLAVTATPSGFVLRGRPQLVYLGTVQRSPDAWSEARGD